MTPPTASFARGTRGDPPTRLQRLVLNAGLPSADPASSPNRGSAGVGDAPLDETAFESLLAFAVEQRATGVLVGAVDSGAIALRAGQLAALRSAHEVALIDCLRLESLLVGLAGMLARSTIDFRVLKGPAVARRWYPEPGWRTFGDIDVLVPTREWAAAAELLVAAGCRRRYREPRAGFTARFGKGACFVAPNGFEIDLHRTFVDGPFGLTLDAARLFDDPQPIAIGGVELATLPDPLLAAHAAVHAVLGGRPPRAMPLRDLAQAMAVGVDAGAVITTATSLGLAAPLGHAVAAMDERLGAQPSPRLSDWAAANPPGPRERRAMAAYTATTTRYARQAFAGWRAVPGARAKVAYARALAWPDRSYLRERDGTVGRRLARAFGVARQRGSAS